MSQDRSEGATADDLDYTPVVDAFTDSAEAWRAAAADRRDGSVYVLHPRLRLAVDVALATRRPLLLRGEPGSGKSSLAKYVARNLGARYFEQVVTASTRVEDFLWRFDAVAKLSDAQAGGVRPDSAYVTRGVLWEAFNPDSDFTEAVVLIDEIDKADPDVPNGLLVPLGARAFHVPPSSLDVVVPAERRVTVVITTNEERQLPPAFVRRCIVASIPPPTQDALVRIATLHVDGPGAVVDEARAALYATLAAKLLDVRESVTRRERPPGVAEYLDAVRACIDLQVDPSSASSTWDAIEEYTLRKPTDVE